MTEAELIKLSEDMKDRIARVNQKIEDACTKAGRDRIEVTLIGVSKVFPVEYAQAAFMAGLNDLGENRVQEIVPKSELLTSMNMNPNWHHIGTLQKNKVKYIIGRTHLIHSVNTIELAEEISKRSVNSGVITSILLQANVSGEESKHGFSPDEMKTAIDSVNALPGLKLCGMMTMAPIETYEGQAREVFENTRFLFEKLKEETKSPQDWRVLSMGMSQDFESAIAEGSTHVRIGTAIFGDRKMYLENSSL